MRKLLLFLPFFLAGGVLLLIAVRGNKENYAVAEEKEVKTLIYGTGYARNKDYLLLRSEVSGYIKEVFVEEGEYVKKGQVLAVLDSGSLEEGIREVSERLKLVRERSKEGSPYLTALESTTEAARINLEKAKKVFERRDRLFSQGLIPREAYEQSKAQYETAQKEYDRARQTYEDAVMSLRADERVLMAERQRLIKEREKYIIKSPIEGYILKRFVNPGDYINHVGQENRLFSIGSKGWEVWLEVDEEYAGMIKEGQRVNLRVDSFPGRDFEGRVLQVVKEVDRARKLITVKLGADLPQETPTGATVEGHIEVERRRALLIPAKAYSDGHVLLYDGVRRVKVPVKLGKQYGEFVEVKEGLKPGDRVLLP
ncbi:MAG: efflux RND transporter periplasmic adaptor subunit [Aquificaceae bacterium]|nr:efflux RND transporter periplasmic adaptor subunit [Aquificaceae bacterium]